ncbi:Receptor-interacting serine/threonine-protein kinase 4 [Trichoderma ghanense]|uniref:Receptor-interacting serine/threonine-protein kinase 4 n=1 Tax=Trichoderma ghanense TaxID=65468 RepID=A0ABY2GXF0_9HYPO
MMETNKIYLHFLLVACLATPATASWWDDFTNNLATDLTPLIALFGEQATKQFLSESTTILDNFIFAMAPLGILTGVVSAIRVCGSPSLRAFIGRAQEGGGIAEAELCSSTSRDVCELYHNGAIVRVFGRPKILEIVYDPVLEANELGHKHEFGINISREYFQKTILNDERWHERGFDDSDDEAKNRLSSANSSSVDFAPNPNLSLNIGIVKRSSWVYSVAAIFGFVAQSSVVLLGAVVNYKLDWTKNDRPIDPWAFPFVFTGTVCVSLGMFLCATLVNDSTKERVFERKDDLSAQNASPSPILYVVQPGNQVVGDQTFDPFLFSRSTNSYMTSWKAPSSSDSNSGPQTLVMSRKNMLVFQKLKRPSDEVSVLIAAFITTVGFVLQFVGLRAMHSVVSLLQLAVTIMMSIVRALLRTQRLSMEANVLRDRPDEVSSHELDWLALQIGKGAHEPRCSWSVVAKTPSRVPPQGSATSDNKAWEYRSRLAKLTGQPANYSSKLSNVWDNGLVSGRLQAQQLRKAIEDSMPIFIAHAEAKYDIKSRDTIPWSLNIATGTFGTMSHHPPNHQAINIPLRKQDSLWTVDQNLLEAIIGLWSWSIMSDPRTEGESFGFKTSSASDIPVYRAIAAGTETETKQTWREIQFWMGRQPNLTLTAFTKGTCPAYNQGTDATTIWHHYKPIIVAGDEPSTPVPLFGKSHPYQRLFGWHGIDALKGPSVGAVKVNSKHIPTLCSQDIYQSFLSTVAASFDLDSEATTVTREKDTMRLEHQLVTKLMESFEASGLGSKQDACLIIVPALQNTSALPRAVKAVPAAYRIADGLRKGDDLREAEGVLQWAWGVISESGEPQDSAMIELGELYRCALFSDDWQAFGNRGISWMDSQRNFLTSHSTKEVVDRYVSLVKRPRANRTGQHVFDAIMARERGEALWSISQLEKGDDFPIDERSGRTVLSFLSQEGWFELVRTVLQIGSVVDSVDSNGRTPLSYAAERGQLSVVAILMEANALPITEDSSRRSPLSYAAGEGHVSVIEKLLSDPRVNIYSKDMQNRSPLHWAAINGHHDAIKCLVNQGGQVDLMDNNHHTPLYAALSNNRREKVGRRQTADLLLQLKSKTELMIQGKEALEWALENGDFTCAEFLLEHREAEQSMGITVTVEVGDVAWRHMDLSTSNSQTGLKTRFFDHENNEKEVTKEDVILVAAKGCRMAIHYVSNGSQQREIICETGYKIISTLLDCVQEAPRIEKLLEAAASNERDAEAITSTLLDHWQIHKHIPIQLTSKLVEGLQIRRNGEQVLRVLLQQPHENIHVTETAVRVIIRHFGVEVMALLLRQLGGQFEVTEDVIEYIHINRRANDIMMLLLNQPRANTPITEAAACLIVKYFDTNIAALLLSRYGENVMVPEDVVSAAAANRIAGRGVMALLLDQRGTQFQITDRTLEAATANPNGRDIIELLLEQRGAEVQVTEYIIKLALSNLEGREDITKLLFDRRGDQVHITEETLQFALQKDAEKDVIELLLDCPGKRFHVTEETMQLALSYGATKDVIELLLDRLGDKLQITEEFFERAKLDWAEAQLIELLLDRLGDQFQITEGIIQLAAAGRRGPAIVELLLDRRGEQIRITEEVLRAAAGSEFFAHRVLQLLFNRRGEQIQITEEVLKAAAGNHDDGYQVMKLLLDRRGEQSQITEEVLKAAAGNHRDGYQVMKLLLDRRGKQIQITEEVLKAAAGNDWNAYQIIELFLDLEGEQIQITEEVLKAAAGSHSRVMELLLDRVEEQVQITEEVLKAAAGGYYLVMNLLLDRRRHQVQITEEVVTAAAGNGYGARGMLELLLDECEDQVYITDTVVKAIVDNEGVDNREELIQLLLDRRREGFQATEKMAEVIPAEWTDIRQRIRDMLEHQ